MTGMKSETKKEKTQRWENRRKMVSRCDTSHHCRRHHGKQLASAKKEKLNCVAVFRLQTVTWLRRSCLKTRDSSGFFSFVVPIDLRLTRFKSRSRCAQSAQVLECASMFMTYGYDPVGWITVANSFALLEVTYRIRETLRENPDVAVIPTRE